MKDRFKKIADLASHAGTFAGQHFSTAQEALAKAGETTRSAGAAAQKALGGAIDSSPQLQTQLQRFSAVAQRAGTLAEQQLSSAQVVLGKAGQNTLLAGVTAHKALGEALQASSQLIGDVAAREETRMALEGARKIAASAGNGGQRLAQGVMAVAREADKNHHLIADRIESVSMGLGITSGVALAAASLVSAPLIVGAAPVIATAGTVAGALSGGAYFYSKWRSANMGKAPPDASVAPAVADEPDTAAPLASSAQHGLPPARE
jgi:hypothetical protein